MYDVKFIGWQDGFGSIEAFPMFNVVKQDHELVGSTLSLATANKEGFKLPKYPSYNEWVKKPLTVK